MFTMVNDESNQETGHFETNQLHCSLGGFDALHALYKSRKPVAIS